MIKSLFPTILAVLFLGCSDKYLAYKNHYLFKSEAGRPDYSNLNYWAAHPWKHDPSDSIPLPLRNEKSDSTVDVFFLHPTTYTKHMKSNSPNADIDDSYINAKTDYSTILYQASAFNGYRVFAPRYRQAHLSMFFTKNTEQADSAFDLAYADLKTAFEYYLKHWNGGRPIIIASHSQGSKMAERLLKEFFEDKPLRNQLVVAYIAGWPLPKDYFSSLKMCTDSLQTGCLCSWRSFRRGYIPSYLHQENGNSFVTNPLTWTTDDRYAPKQLNKGSVLTRFNKVYRHVNDAQVHNGFLWIQRPKFPWGFLYFSKNYHPGDINLFYMNIRENIRQRVGMFRKK